MDYGLTDWMGKQLVVYDLDGTLVDTLQDITDAANHMLRALGLPPLPAEAVRRYIGRGVRQLVADCLGTEDPERLGRGLTIYRAHYGRHLLDHSRLYPGARELLDHFKDRTQAVITNKPNPYSRQILERLGVEGYFAAIVGGDAEHPRKPDPAAMRSLMDQAGVAPAQTLFVGDSTIDVETGRNAGVLTVAVLHGLGDADALERAGPDVLVRDLPELLTLARRERW